MDLTKLSDADLLALNAGDYSKMSDDGLRALKSSSAPEPSGVAAGAMHGAMEIVHGPAETLKRFAGVGPGRKVDDPNYVPANVTNGTWDFTKWNGSQLLQKVAELAPSVVPDYAAGAAGAKVGKKFGGIKGAALGALLGAALSGTARTAGDTAKEVTVARTGDANAPSSTADLVRGGATAGAASLAGSLLPARLAGAVSPLGSVGTAGALDAAKRYGLTTALSGAGAVGSDAITQAGTTIGTDKGLTIDPSRFPEAFAGGIATGAVMAAPKFAGDAARAANNREFGGANKEATANYATRLADHGEGIGGLGNSIRDAKAQKLVKDDLKNELGNAVKDIKGLSPDADNAVSRAVKDETITPKDLELIEKETAAHPDGANAAYLARTLRVAQLAQSKGSYKNDRWAGGVSGAFDANIGYMLNPFRGATGLVASGLGVNLLGSSSPKVAAAALGTYGIARAIDSMTGMRSPAQTMAEHFADRSAQLRLPQTQPPQPQQPQGPVPNGPWNPAPPAPAYGPTGAVTGLNPVAQPPWGPRPLPTTSVPQQAAPGLTPAPAPAPTPSTINPLALPRDITTPAKNVVNGLMLAQKLKQDAQAKDAVSSLPSPLMDEAPLNVTDNPQIGKRASQLVSAAKALQKYTGADVQAKEEAQAQKANELALKAQDREAAKDAKVKARIKEQETRAKAKAEATKAKEDAKLELAKVKAAAAAVKQAQRRPSAASLSSASSGVTADVPAPKKITKANGKVEADAPALSIPYEPLAEEYLYPKGISPKEYAKREAASKGKAGNAVYEGKAEASERRRQGIASDLKAKHPTAARAIDWLQRELQRVGVNPHDVERAIKHAQDNVTDDVASALEAFKK